MLDVVSPKLISNVDSSVIMGRAVGVDSASITASVAFSTRVLSALNCDDVRHVTDIHSLHFVS